MKFVAIDFETANSESHSACEIGLSLVENGRIVETISRLIKPRNNWFNSFNTRLHGIDAATVSVEPEFNDLWSSEIKDILDGSKMVAHNAGFDVGVLKSVLDQYDIDMPTIDYACTVRMARKTWKGLNSYSLGLLSDYLGVPLLKHHRAGDDAKACADIAIRCMEAFEIDSFDELSSKMGINIGQIRPGDYVPIRLGKGNRIARIEFDKGKEDPSSPLYQKTFVFTGRMSSAST